MADAAVRAEQVDKVGDSAIKLAMPSLDGASRSGRSAPVGNEQIKRQAYAEGLEQGRARGEQLGLEQAEQEIQRLRQIMGYLHQPLVDLDNQVLESLASLAVRLAGQLLKRELDLDPARFIPVISAAIEQLPMNNERPRVLLNPQDMELVARAQAEQPAGTGTTDNAGATNGHDIATWILVADPSILPGECRVEAHPSRVDLGLDARLKNLLGTLLDEDAPLPG